MWTMKIMVPATTSDYCPFKKGPMGRPGNQSSRGDTGDKGYPGFEGHPGQDENQVLKDQRVKLDFLVKKEILEIMYTCIL